MPEEHLIITIYCIVDEIIKSLKLSPLRTRGYPPCLSDDEVITMEIVGKFLGLHEDKAIHSYFSRHWHELFPKIPHRTTFVRQASNLWFIKQLVQEVLARNLGAYDDNIHISDGFPLPVCAFRRALGRKLFVDHTKYGHCSLKKMTYYGFQGIITISFDGIISAATLTSAQQFPL